MFLINFLIIFFAKKLNLSLLVSVTSESGLKHDVVSNLASIHKFFSENFFKFFTLIFFFFLSCFSSGELI